jgi:hypothetical protein
MAFDNDEVLDSNDDEDLQNDPVSQMDMQVCKLMSSIIDIAHSTGKSRAICSDSCVNALRTIPTILALQSIS